MSECIIFVVIKTFMHIAMYFVIYVQDIGEKPPYIGLQVCCVISEKFLPFRFSFFKDKLRKESVAQNYPLGQKGPKNTP